MKILLRPDINVLLKDRSYPNKDKLISLQGGWLNNKVTYDYKEQVFLYDNDTPVKWGLWEEVKESYYCKGCYSGYIKEEEYCPKCANEEDEFERGNINLSLLNKDRSRHYLWSSEVVVFSLYSGQLRSSSDSIKNWKGSFKRWYKRVPNIKRTRLHVRTDGSMVLDLFYNKDNRDLCLELQNIDKDILQDIKNYFNITIEGGHKKCHGVIT